VQDIFGSKPDDAEVPPKKQKNKGENMLTAG
jgi:hypothetical protein